MLIIFRRDFRMLAPASGSTTWWMLIIFRRDCWMLILASGSTTWWMSLSFVETAECWPQHQDQGGPIEAEARTTAPHILATSWKFALTTWQPRLNPTCVCKQLLERNRYSTTNALLMHGGLSMYPLKRVEAQAKALNIVDVVEDQGSSYLLNLMGTLSNCCVKEGTAVYGVSSQFRGFGV